MIPLCPNAAAAIRLSTLVIGKAKNPRPFKNVTNLSLVYRRPKDLLEEC